MRRLLISAAPVVAGGLTAPLASASAPDPGQLRAGAAQVDITPKLGGTTLGYVRPDMAVDGVLIARVADLGYTRANVLYTGTHTHSGPEDLADWQVEQLAQAIRRADKALTPVKAAWGSAVVRGVARNRSIEAHLANHGSDLAYGQGYAEVDPDGAEHTVDDTLRVLRVDKLNGTPLSAWVEFPVHLTASTPYNTLWDTEIAGPTLEHLTSRIAAPGFVGLYSNGASGDLQPAPGGGGVRRLAHRRSQPRRGPAGRRAVDQVLLLRPGGRGGQGRLERAGLGPALLRRVRGRRVDLPRAAGDRRAATARGSR